MKRRIILMLIALISINSALGQNLHIKRVAILETVDKEDKVSYGVKLMVRSQLSAAITSTPGYEAYDRVDISSIMSEHDFQRTGLVSNNDIKRLGEMTGAEFILVAEAAYLNSSYIFLVAQILNVETARVEQTANIQTMTTIDELEKNCKILAGKLLNVKVDKTGKFYGELMLGSTRYIGEYSNGLPNGKGVAYFSNGDIYDGDWFNGKREGKGKITYEDGTTYEGEFKNDMFNGQGIFLYRGGSKDIGRWLNGDRLEYTQYYENGDKRIYSAPDGIGGRSIKYVSSDGSYHTVYVDKQNRKQGKEYAYTKDGVLKAVGVYNDDRLSESVKYDTSGSGYITRKEVFTYVDGRMYFKELIMYQNGIPYVKYIYNKHDIIQTIYL